MSRGVRKKTSKKAPAPPPPSGREATKQETREALIRAGMALFAEQGLDVPSLDALCARAGFTRGAFYVHFADREDFIVAVMERATGTFLDAILAAEGAIDLGQVVGAFAAAVSGGAFPVFGAVPPHQVLAACARSPRLRKRYLALLEEARRRLADAARAGQRAGKIRPDVDPEKIAGLLLAIALGVGTMMEIEVPFDAGEHAAAMIDLVRPR
jgi:AcrR family transcriptional regulator